MKTRVSVDVESIVQSFMHYIICKLQKMHMRSRVRTWKKSYKCDCFVIGRGTEKSDRGDACMLEELDVAAEVEVEESVETEDQEEITLNREEDDHEQITITRKHEIKWRHSPQSSILPFRIIWFMTDIPWVHTNTSNSMYQMRSSIWCLTAPTSMPCKVAH